jgi:hypothetical protein
MSGTHFLKTLSDSDAVRASVTLSSPSCDA